MASPDTALSPEHYRRQFEVVCSNATVALFIMDEHQRCSYMNPAAEQLTGFTLAEVQGRTLHEMIHHTYPDGRPYPISECPIDRAFPENNQQQGEEVFVHKDGHFYPVAFTASPIRDASRAVVGTVIEVQNIAERKRAEARLAESEYHYRCLVELNPQVPWVADAAGRIVDFNQRWLDWTGLTRAAALGDAWMRVQHPDDRARVTGVWARSVRTGEPYDVEHRVRLADGSYRWMRSRAAPRRDPSGKIVRWYGSTEDIDARKRAEQHNSQLISVVQCASDFIGIARIDDSGTGAPRYLGVVARDVSERERDTAALAERERTLTQFMSGSPALMGIVELLDDAPDILHILDNAASARFFGLPEGTTAGRRASADLGVDAATTASWMRHYRESDRTGEPVRFEYSYTVNGVTRWLDAVVSPLGRGAAGRRRFCYVAQDITSQKHAEHALREAEAKFRLLANSIPQLAWMARGDGWIFWYNDRWYAYTGTTLDDMQGWGWEKVHDPKELPRVTARWRAALASGEPWEDVFPLRRHDGELRWHLSRASPLKDERGRVELWFGTNTDITEQRRIEHELRLSESRFNVALKNAPIIVYTCDRALRYTWIQNPLGGFTAADVVGKRDDELLPPAAVAELMAFKRHVLDSQRPGRRTITLSGDTMTKHFDVTAEPLFADDDPTSVVGLTVAAMDITELRQAAEEKERLLKAEQAAREELQRASLLKDEFLATLSHELRTPLHAILGWCHILRRRHGESEELGRALAVIERNARAQSQLIDDLLDMNRIVSGKMRLDVHPADIAEVIRAAIESVAPAAEAKGVHVQPIIDPGVGPVRGDPARLQQVVWNLLSNAIKFTPRGGKVRVVLERVNSHVEIVVNDTGQGIPAHFLPHVFDRFRQADASTTRLHTGLGLGLAIVKHLVELHGGRVRAASLGEHRGATFTVELPLSPVHEEADDSRVHPRGLRAGDEGPPLPAALLDGVTVLVVDDEADARELLRCILVEAGAGVRTAASAAEALVVLERERADVLVSDIGMPVEDGYELIRRVRSLPPAAGGAIPAAALTAFARSEDRQRALLAGFQAHVVKPVEPAELITVVASLAGKLRG